MDNLTHTLIGAAIAESAHFALSKPKLPKFRVSRRGLFHWASFLGNNFPDLDSLYAKITPGPLGYLLHHRGHSHTLIAIVPQAVFLFLVVIGIYKLSGKLKLERRDFWATAAIITLGLFAHLFADSWNSYGVHPFYPWNSKWYYGDAVFIIEPLIWGILGMSLLWQLQSKIARILLPLVLAGLTLLLTQMGAMSVGTYLFFIGFMAAAGWGFFRLAPVLRSSVALMLVLGVVGSLKSASLYAKQKLHRSLTSLRSPGEHINIHDISVHPAPAQPFCWSFVSAETEVTQRKYVARQGYFSIAPNWVNISSCPQAIWYKASPQLEGDLIVVEKHEVDLEKFSKKDRDHCTVSAWLRFARVPVFNGRQVYDLRFSSKQRSNFSLIELAETKAGSCPPHIPLWEKPRQDILVESSRMFAGQTTEQIQ